MIKHVIFDFGNVLGRFHADDLMMRCMHRHDEKLKQLIFRNWDDLDAGKIEYTQYVEETIALADPCDEKDLRAFFGRWYLELDPIEEIGRWISELKKDGYGCYVLSNAPEIFEENVYHYDIIQKMDGGVYSGRIQLAKPDHRIYHYLLSQYQLKAEECFFLDDKKENVEAARACGIMAMVYDHNLDEIKKFVQK